MQEIYNVYSRHEIENGDWQKIAYENLANAIIKSACDEYVDIYVGNMGKPSPKNPKLISLINFFNSEWYSELTNVDASYLIRLLNERGQQIIKQMQEEE